MLIPQLIERINVFGVNMKGKLKSLIVLSILACISGQAAYSDTYNCAVKEFGPNHGISPVLIFKIYQNSDRMLIHDVSSLTMKRRPWIGYVRGRAGNRIDFKWKTTVKGFSNGSPMTVIGDYSAVLIPNSGKIYVHGSFRGADNMLGGEGRCQLEK